MFRYWREKGERRADTRQALFRGGGYDPFNQEFQEEGLPGPQLELDRSGRNFAHSSHRC